MSTTPPEAHIISISRIEVRDGVEVSVLRLRGEVRAETVSDFESRLAESGERASFLVVDLSELDYINSLGLGMLLRQRELQNRRGGWLRAVAPSPAVAMIMKLSGVGKILPPYPTIEHALGDLASNAA